MSLEYMIAIWPSFERNLTHAWSANLRLTSIKLDTKVIRIVILKNRIPYLSAPQLAVLLL